MIVGKHFEGDDSEVAWKQHEVYAKALSIIVSICNQHIECARSLLHSSENPEWGTIGTFDHRTLQFVHDLLAAAWRSRNDFRQSSLLPDGNRSLEEVQPLWLEWLRNEVMKWNSQPDLVRSVQMILANQNKGLGDEAEAQLCLDIIEKFSDVSWERMLRDACVSDLRKYKLKQTIEPLGPTSPASDYVFRR